MKYRDSEMEAVKGTILLKACSVQEGWPLQQVTSLHLCLSLNLRGRWGTTDDFTTSFLYFSLFSTALWDWANTRLVQEIKLKIKDFVSKFSVDFIFNLESYLHEWQSVGLNVENAVKCHSWLNSYRQPFWSCSFGDMSMQLLCPRSKRWCVIRLSEGGDVAQLVERWLIVPLKQVWFPGVARDFCSNQLSLQTLLRCPFSFCVQLHS